MPGLEWKRKMKKFQIILNRECLAMDVYAAGIVQGVLYGLCSIPCETKLWDCEQFGTFYSYFTECTQDHIDKFKSFMDLAFPGLYEIRELK